MMRNHFQPPNRLLLPALVLGFALPSGELLIVPPAAAAAAAWRCAAPEPAALAKVAGAGGGGGGGGGAGMFGVRNDIYTPQIGGGMVGLSEGIV